MRFYTVPAEEVKRLGSYLLLRYRWTEVKVEPGQFVMARPADYPATLNPFLARPLSVYDQDGDMVSLLFEVRGRGTALLARAAGAIQVSAPLGRGFAVGPTREPAALLGGGVGVAPLKILSRRLGELGVAHDVFLGFADAASAAVAGEFPGCRVATMDGSRGARGTVLDVAADLTGYRTVYACGPNPMLSAVKRVAGGGSDCQLSVEERMGCGNGSCNGCVVPVRGDRYVRSCIEGPVFDAEVLAW